MVFNDDNGGFMSVIIKSIQIPDNCDVCLFSDWSNLHQTSCCKLKEYEPGFQDYSIDYRTQRSNICPLVELPGHHGRLIDADRLMRVYEDRLEKVIDRYGDYSSEAGILSGAMKLLMDQTYNY
jgi:hypothetical protein